MGLILPRFSFSFLPYSASHLSISSWHSCLELIHKFLSPPLLREFNCIHPSFAPSPDGNSWLLYGVTKWSNCSLISYTLLSHIKFQEKIVSLEKEGWVRKTTRKQFLNSSLFPTDLLSSGFFRRSSFSFISHDRRSMRRTIHSFSHFMSQIHTWMTRKSVGIFLLSLQFSILFFLYNIFLF